VGLFTKRGVTSRASPAVPVPPEDRLAALSRRLAETEQHPLKRIPAADLEGEARGIAERINARLDAVASAEKEQQQFIADVSHELRTPLTVLRGSLEVVLEEDRPAEEYREAIGNALLEVRHLSRLSQNLLFLARGQAGRITLSFANVDLVRFVADVTRELQPAASDQHIPRKCRTGVHRFHDRILPG
jgi:two-component system OmpR family sensor kinase